MEIVLTCTNPGISFRDARGTRWHLHLGKMASRNISRNRRRRSWRPFQGHLSCRRPLWHTGIWRRQLHNSTQESVAYEAGNKGWKITLFLPSLVLQSPAPTLPKHVQWYEEAQQRWLTHRHHWRRRRWSPKSRVAQSCCKLWLHILEEPEKNSDAVTPWTGLSISTCTYRLFIVAVGSGQNLRGRWLAQNVVQEVQIGFVRVGRCRRVRDDGRGSTRTSNSKIRWILEGMNCHWCLTCSRR